MKKIICIIPALERNMYSELGDLVNWGETTLLEWKISQVKDSNIFDKIYISSPSKKISQLAKKNNIDFILRENAKNIDQLYIGSAKRFKNCNIAFMSTTFPFFNPNLINKFVKNFIKSEKDVSLTSITENEYFAFNKRYLNIDTKKKLLSRRKVNPIVKILPAGIIGKSNELSNKKNIFSNKSNFFEIDWLSSLEINSPNDLDVFQILIKEYFKRTFI